VIVPSRGTGSYSEGGIVYGWSLLREPRKHTIAGVLVVGCIGLVPGRVRWCSTLNLFSHLDALEWTRGST